MSVQFYESSQGRLHVADNETLMMCGRRLKLPAQPKGRIVVGRVSLCSQCGHLAVRELPPHYWRIRSESPVQIGPVEETPDE